MTGKNILLALLLSLFITLIIGIIWVFYPLLTVIISNQEGSGIGGAGGSLSFSLVAIEVVLFIIIFAVL